jgi:single-strand DNA-binding protein
VEKYCKKGDRIYVEGRIDYKQWQDKENQTRYSTEINVRELLMLGGKGGGGGGGDFEGESSGRNRAPAAAGAKSSTGSGGADFEDFPGALQETDDDLPF